MRFFKAKIPPAVPSSKDYQATYPATGISDQHLAQ